MSTSERPGEPPYDPRQPDPIREPEPGEDLPAGVPLERPDGTPVDNPSG